MGSRRRSAGPRCAEALQFTVLFGRRGCAAQIPSNAVESVGEVTLKCLHGPDQADSNESCNQSIFDCGRPFFIAEERRHYIGHFAPRISSKQLENYLCANF